MAHLVPRYLDSKCYQVCRARLVVPLLVSGRVGKRKIFGCGVYGKRLIILWSREMRCLWKSNLLYKSSVEMQFLFFRFACQKANFSTRGQFFMWKRIFVCVSVCVCRCLCVCLCVFVCVCLRGRKKNTFPHLFERRKKYVSTLNFFRVFRKLFHMLIFQTTNAAEAQATRQCRSMSCSSTFAYDSVMDPQTPIWVQILWPKKEHFFIGLTSATLKTR
jgi:hypothetical protein